MTTGRPKFDDERPQIDEGKGGMKLPSGGMMMYIIIAIIVLAVSFGVNQFFGASKSNITEMNAAIEAMKSDLRASKDSITTALNGLAGQVESKVNSATSSLTSKVNDASLAASGAKEQANAATSQANQAINKLNELETKLINLQAAINEANESYQEIKEQYDALKAQYDALKTAFDAHVAVVTTTTATPTTTPTTITSNATITCNLSSITLLKNNTTNKYENGFTLYIKNLKSIGLNEITFTAVFQIPNLSITIGETIGDTINELLGNNPFISLPSSYGSITWVKSNINPNTRQVTYIGTYSGYIDGGSLDTITTNINFIASPSSQPSLILNILSVEVNNSK